MFFSSNVHYPFDVSFLVKDFVKFCWCFNLFYADIALVRRVIRAGTCYSWGSLFKVWSFYPSGRFLSLHLDINGCLVRSEVFALSRNAIAAQNHAFPERKVLFNLQFSLLLKPTYLRETFKSPSYLIKVNFKVFSWQLIPIFVDDSCFSMPSLISENINRSLN